MAQRKAAESLDLVDGSDASGHGNGGYEEAGRKSPRSHADWHLRREDLEAWLHDEGDSREFLRRLLHHVTDLCPTCAAGLAGSPGTPEPPEAGRPAVMNETAMNETAAGKPTDESSPEPSTYAEVFRVALGRAREHEKGRAASGNAGSAVAVMEHVRSARGSLGDDSDAAAEALENAWREAERLPGHAPTTIYLENQALLHCTGAQLSLSDGRLAEAWRAMRTAQILAGGILDPIIRAELRITHGLLFWAEGEPVLAFQRLASAWARLAAVGQIDRAQSVLAALAWIDERAELGGKVSLGKGLAAGLAEQGGAGDDIPNDIVAVLKGWERRAVSADAVH